MDSPKLVDLRCRINCGALDQSYTCAWHLASCTLLRVGICWGGSFVKVGLICLQTLAELKCDHLLLAVAVADFCLNDNNMSFDLMMLVFGEREAVDG